MIDNHTRLFFVTKNIWFSKTKKKEIDFITGDNSGFAVWDEGYYDIIGLFPTYFEAKANLKEYVETHLGQEYIY